VFPSSSKLIRASRSISVLALIPVLLWPVVVRTHCCCIERERLVTQLRGEGLQDGESGDSTAACATTEGSVCRMCCSAQASAFAKADGAVLSPDSQPFSARASCDCIAKDLNTTLALRTELTESTELKCLSENSLLGYFVWPRISPSIVLGSFFPADQCWTSRQRCALLCCWLK
jgi:hypothetical protein